MDANAILLKLGKLMPNAFVSASKSALKGEIDPHQPTLCPDMSGACGLGLALAHLELHRFRAVAEALHSDRKFEIDWVENISIVNIEKNLVATWFFRSSETGACLALRAAVAPPGPEDWAGLPSVRDLWPMAEPFENDASELFGIRFFDTKGVPLEVHENLIPVALRDEVRGFPLRKEFDVRCVPRPLAKPPAEEPSK